MTNIATQTGPVAKDTQTDEQWYLEQRKANTPYASLSPEDQKRWDVAAVTISNRTNKANAQKMQTANKLIAKIGNDQVTTLAHLVINALQADYKAKKQYKGVEGGVKGLFDAEVNALRNDAETIAKIPQAIAEFSAAMNDLAGTAMASDAYILMGVTASKTARLEEIVIRAKNAVQ